MAFLKLFAKTKKKKEAEKKSKRSQSWSSDLQLSPTQPSKNANTSPFILKTPHSSSDNLFGLESSPQAEEEYTLQMPEESPEDDLFQLVTVDPPVKRDRSGSSTSSGSTVTDTKVELFQDESEDFEKKIQKELIQSLENQVLELQRALASEKKLTARLTSELDAERQTVKKQTKILKRRNQEVRRIQDNLLSDEYPILVCVTPPQFKKRGANSKKRKESKRRLKEADRVSNMISKKTLGDLLVESASQDSPSKT